jgi:DNA-binding MarR family transcriptional regulator
MKQKKNTFTEFSSTVLKVQMAFKCFMRKKLKEHGIDLSFEMLEVLKCLWEKEGLKQQDVADFVMKDKASLTLLIDNLTRRNLVKRTEDPNDRRNKLVTLTEEGAALKYKIQPWIDEMYGMAGTDVPEEMLREGIVLFDKIYGNLKATEYQYFS